MGGAVVAIYTEGLYRSGDLDIFRIRNSTTNKIIDFVRLIHDSRYCLYLNIILSGVVRRFDQLTDIPEGY